MKTVDFHWEKIIQFHSVQVTSFDRPVNHSIKWFELFRKENASAPVRLSPETCYSWWHQPYSKISTSKHHQANKCVIPPKRVRALLEHRPNFGSNLNPDCSDNRPSLFVHYDKDAIGNGIASKYLHFVRYFSTNNWGLSKIALSSNWPMECAAN